MKKLLFLGLVCLLTLQCGYHLRGTGSSLPDHVEKVSIPMFNNKTTRFEVEVKFTQSVIDEMVARGKVEIVVDESSADAILLGDIISFQAVPIAFTGESIADRYQVIVTAKIVMRDLVRNRIIFSNPYYVYQGEYEVPEGTDFDTVETEAMNEIAVKFARSLVISILEGF